MIISRKKIPAQLILLVNLPIILITALFFFKENFKTSELKIQIFCQEITGSMLLDRAVDKAHGLNLVSSHVRENKLDESITVIGARRRLTAGWSVCSLRHDTKSISSVSYNQWYH